ncbi:hypothetical protein [Niveibacterium sp. SC-1]|uniref:hypothetical protein n=1 Tax=Niveibacterium sp. SC-1 TaxID=3135646 RepID=UPI00311DB0D9
MRAGPWLPLLLLPLLSACENDAAAYAVEGRNHAITLVREQPYPFAPTVKQALVVARFPDCQRRFALDEGTAADSFRMELWALRDRLFVARQGKTWYAIGTDKCQVQKMKPIADTPPGTLVGTYRRKNGALVFDPVPGASRPAGSEAAGEVSATE